jgi:biotin carboxylase
MNDTKTLKGKRLLILGGNIETKPLVQKANNLNVTTFVLDPDPNSVAKKSAAHALTLDGMNVPGIVQAARDNNIDGILVGVADSLIPSYLHACQELALPCYATNRSVDAFSSKERFIRICREHSIDTTPSYNLQELQERTSEEDRFPVIVKPVDRGAGIGMTICNNPSELPQAVNTAMEASLSRKFIIERLMKCRDLFAYYTFIDGKAYLSAIADRITTGRQKIGSPVCIGALYPSDLRPRFIQNVAPKLEKMFEDLEIQNGVLNIQFFNEGEKFYAYDPGFRLQGEAPHLHLLAANGFDHSEMLINFALTGRMSNHPVDQLNNADLMGRYGATVWILLKAGTISHVAGLNEIRALPSFITELLRFNPGETVTPQMLGTERQVFARFYLQHRDGKQLRRDINGIGRCLKVEDILGESMILDGIGLQHNE